MIFEGVGLGRQRPRAARQRHHVREPAAGAGGGRGGRAARRRRLLALGRVGAAPRAAAARAGAARHASTFPHAEGSVGSAQLGSLFICLFL